MIEDEVTRFGQPRRQVGLVLALVSEPDHGPDTGEDDEAEDHRNTEPGSWSSLVPGRRDELVERSKAPWLRHTPSLPHEG